MSQLIQVLHLEDDALDAELVRATLEAAGIVCQIKRVQDRDEFTQALQQREYDLILGDYRLPAYDGLSAVRLAQELRPDLPFIFVSGTLGEDAAIEGFTQGATDYVLKQKLARLVPAIERALREAENQRRRQQAEAALHERVQQSQSLARLAKELEHAQTYAEIVNAARAEVQAVIGYQNLWVYLLTEDRAYYTALVADGELGERVMSSDGIATLKIEGDPMLEEIAAATQIVLVDEARLDARTNKTIVAQLGNRTIVNVPIILFDKHLGAVGTGTFGNEGVRSPTPSEQEYLMAMASHMAVSLDRLRLSDKRRQAEEAQRISEQKFRSFVEESSEGITLLDEEGTIIEWNRAREKMTGLAASQVLGRLLWDVQYDMLPPESRTPERGEQTRQVMTDALRTGRSALFDNVIEAEILTQAGERRYIQQTIFPIKTDRGYRIGSVTRDITERKHAEAERQAHLRFFARMDQINRAMQGTNDLEQMMRDVLDAVLSIFDCDRAWLVYPCDPETATWQASMERTRPEYPAVIPIGAELPIDPAGIEVFRMLRSTSGPVKFGPGATHPIPDVMVQAFNIQAFMATAIYPKVGKPWSFGLHQCSYPRVWTPEEERLLQEIGRRLSDALTSLLIYRDLRESEERFSKAFRLSPMAIGIMRTTDGRFVDVNDVFVRTSGYSREEIIGRTSAELALWVNPEQQQPQLQRLQAQGSVVSFDFDLRTKSGEVRTGLSSTTQIDLSGEKHFLSLIQDITERKRAEARILRLNRLYATLSQINQTIVHVRDRASLFEQICRVAVEHGQFRMAWISQIDEAAARIVPAAIAGEERGYVTTLQLTARDEPAGRGTTGTAMREGRCIICQDIATDPGMQPWRDAALQRGYRSSAAVPIRQNGRVVGALTVYAAEPHSIDTEDKALLDEIGQDISFALDGLEQEAQRQRAELELSQLNAELEQRVIERTAELARAHEQLRAILDTAGEGVVFTDSQGAIEYINPALERLTGYTADEVLGHNPRMWKSDQTPPATYQQMWRALVRGEIWQGELINRRKDGTLYTAALTASPVTDIDGHAVGYVGVQRDISRQKELDRLKDQFVSTVSHELRTPLANVMLHINLLTRGRPERHDIYLRTLQREAERLRNMIEDLLDLSRLDRNVTPIQFAPTDMQLLLEPLVLDRAALAAQRGLTLQYEPAPGLPVVACDASMLTQVISNLLTNALNYTPPGGEITVLTAIQRTADQHWITVTVRDTGPGIAAKDLAHLFERFYRGEAGRKADAPGTGLGLAISQEIMGRLGGRITVESEPGHGAAFTVWVKAEVA
ncbi:MAG: PAS domain S-box protein [Thermoflexales bacterium]|nr:PAS domain S-box protein [Thermoflexales bacterium]